MTTPPSGTVPSQIINSLASQDAIGGFEFTSVFHLFKKLLDLHIPEVNKITNKILVRLGEVGEGAIEKDKRSRSIVISGLPELEKSSDGAWPPASARQDDTERKVRGLMDILDVECRPVRVYRMGRKEVGKPRLVKVELPTKGHWVTTLSRARLLRDYPDYKGVFIRRSMTAREREQERELRERARQMNQSRAYEDRFVVYKGELIPASNLSHSQSSSQAPYPLRRQSSTQRGN